MYDVIAITKRETLIIIALPLTAVLFFLYERVDESNTLSHFVVGKTRSE